MGVDLSAPRKTIALSGSVAACSLLVAFFTVTAPGTTSPEEWSSPWTRWTVIWPLLVFGVATYLANEFMFLAARKKRPTDPSEEEPTTRVVRNAALTAEPLVVFILAAIPSFRDQIPVDASDRLLQVASCCLMVTGAMGAAVLEARTRQIIDAARQHSDRGIYVPPSVVEPEEPRNHVAFRRTLKARPQPIPDVVRSAELVQGATDLSKPETATRYALDPRTT